MAKRLTPRQIAGRLNWRKRKGLTPEGRQSLRMAAIANRPWERSTGPRTDAGKAASRGNSYKDGARAIVLVPGAFQVFLAEQCGGSVPGHAAVIAMVNAADTPDLVMRANELIMWWTRAVLRSVAP